jgi:hypothetical protein
MVLARLLSLLLVCLSPISWIDVAYLSDDSGRVIDAAGQAATSHYGSAS